MEERTSLPPTTHDNHHNSHDDNDKNYNQVYPNDTDPLYTAMQIVTSSSSHRRDETLIVQVPKDQIYRVPPPENADIIERRSNPFKKTTDRRRRCFFWFFSIILLVAFIIAVIVCVYRFTLSPKPPTFSIKRVSALKKPKSGFGFRVWIQTTNPNVVNDLGVEQGNTLILYKGKKIGKGRFPPLDLEETKKSDEVDLVVDGKGDLPKKMDNLELAIDVAVKMKTWLWSKKANVKVWCQVEFESFGENSRITSQKCDVSL